MKLTPHQRWQWFLAVVVAAFYKASSPREWFKGARAVFRSMFSNHGDEVSDEIYQKRMEICRECPVFYDKLETCGSPLREEFKDVGCSCYLPVLARLNSGHCWLKTNTDLQGVGWTDDLLSEHR